MYNFYDITLQIISVCGNKEPQVESNRVENGETISKLQSSLHSQGRPGKYSQTALK
jgi:hypothetical protein